MSYQNSLNLKYSVDPRYVCKSKINSLTLKVLNIPGLTIAAAKNAFDRYDEKCVVEQVGHPYDISKRKFVQYMKLSDLRNAILFEKQIALNGEEL